MSRLADRYLRTLDSNNPRDLPQPPQKVQLKASNPTPTSKENKRSHPRPQDFVRPGSPAKRVNNSGRPDHQPLLHNQELAPSAVKWDVERQNWQAYEYLCHVSEARDWMEHVLDEALPEPTEFPESLQNGVTLAKLVRRFRPDIVTRPIFEHRRLQYRHTENIVYFMELLKALEIPDLFTFDVTDLYEKRNLPKVIYCLHALSHYLEAHGARPIVDLVGKLEFTESQLTSTQKGLDAAGSAMPNFGAMTRHFSAKGAPEAYQTLDAEIENLGIRTPPPVFERDLSPEEIMLMELEDVEDKITLLQARCRGSLRRKSISPTELLHADSTMKSIISVQAFARGNLARRSRRLPSVCVIESIQALSRGHLARLRLNRFKKELEATEKGVVGVQSAFRGVILRFRIGCLYDDLDQQINHIVELQTRIRGALARREHSKAVESWNLHGQEVVKIQAVWRARAQKSRYRALMVNPHPSLTDLWSFLHLVDESPADYAAALELEELRKQVATAASHNDAMDSKIKRLDTKIALLFKNKVALSLDDMPQPVKPLKDTFDSKTLSKLSHERLDQYQKLLYVLQTQPKYLGHFIRNAPLKISHTRGHIETSQLVAAVFGGSSPANREKYHLMRLLSWSIRHQTANQATSAKLVQQFDQKASTKALKALVTPAINLLRVVPHELESNPLTIWRSLGLPLAGETAETAIQDPRVRQQFVHNLQRLREVAASFVRIIADASSTGIPFHILWLAREASTGEFNRSHSERAAQTAAVRVVLGTWILPAFAQADRLGLVDAGTDGVAARNLASVSKILHQICLSQPFSPKEPAQVFLQPLNEFVVSSSQRLAGAIQRQISSLSDLERQYGTTLLDDFTQAERPHLQIPADLLLALHSVVFNERSQFAEDGDSTLIPIVSALGPLPSDARELLDLARFGNVDLELNPGAAPALPASTEGGETSMGDDALMATVKRCLVYVLRVQRAATLLEVLVSPVELEHEHAYNLVSPPQDGELGNLTFRELKLLTLEKILELESAGRVTRADGYQSLITALAGDLRNKDELRQSRQSDLDAARATLAGLSSKGEYLQTRLETYTTYIEQSVATLQNSHQQQQRRRSLLPFNTNSASTDTAKYGTYRTTGDKLMERGILIRIRGYTDRQLRDVQVTISSDSVAQFLLVVVYKGIQLPGGSAKLTIDDLLDLQYADQPHLDLFGNVARFNLRRLTQLIFRKFLDAE